MFTAAFFRALLERAVKTFAQSLVALLVASGTDLIHTNWGQNLSVAGMASLLSVLTSIASGGTGNGPSAIKAEVLSPPAAPEPPAGV